MKVFCTTCHTMREVMDTYLTDDGDLYRENAGQGSGASTYQAVSLECGHSGGHAPGPRPSTPLPHRPDLVRRVVELQEGAREVQPEAR